MLETRRQALYANSQRNRRVALNSYRYGWPIDKQRQARIADEIAAEITKCDELLSQAIGELKAEHAITDALRLFFDNFNANSGQQVAKLFYDILEEPIRVRTKQGAASTGKAALDQIEKTGSPEAAHVAKLIRKRKVYTKLEEAYIKNLADATLVRPAAHVTAQVGGRWSYRDPALQTVPPPIKPMFVAHPGCWLIACDLSQAELRSMAQQSGDPAMCGAYRQGRDIHRETAAEISGVPPDEVTKAQRKIAKPIGLGYNYSVLDDEAAAAGLYAQVAHMAKGLTFPMLLGALKRLDRARPKVREFKISSLKRAEELDYVEEPLHHRRRYFYGKVKDTEVYNFPHQAMIAAIMDRAVQGIDAEFAPGEGLHLQRHDELILGGPDPLRLCALLWKHMRQEIDLNNGAGPMLYEIEFLITRRWGQGVAVEPKGAGFVIACAMGCGWHAEADNLAVAVTTACEHYDGCQHRT